ncbi:hypothetical protein N9N67_06250 [Bacteriovoracaceae bacterium]|nr:hypothetical protein [Bacteriovoracaceae bacterium]
MFKLNLKLLFISLSFYTLSLCIYGAAPRPSYVILKDGGQTGHGGIGKISTIQTFDDNGEGKHAQERIVNLVHLLDLTQYINNLNSEIFYTNYFNSTYKDNSSKSIPRFECSPNILRKVRDGFSASNLSHTIFKSDLRKYHQNITTNFCKILTGLKNHSNSTIVAIILKALERSDWQVNSISDSYESVHALQSYIGINELFLEDNLNNQRDLINNSSNRAHNEDRELDLFNYNELDSMFNWKEIIYGSHNPAIIENTESYIQIALRKKNTIYLNKEIIRSNDQDTKKSFIISPFSFSWLIFHELVYLTLQSNSNHNLSFTENIYDGAQVQQIVSSVFKKLFLTGVYEKLNKNFLTDRDRSLRELRESYYRELSRTLRQEIYDSLTGSYPFNFDADKSYFDLFTLDNDQNPVFVIEQQYNSSLFNQKSSGIHFINAKDISTISLNLYYQEPVLKYWRSISISGNIGGFFTDFYDFYGKSLIDESIRLIKEGDGSYNFGSKTFLYACLAIHADNSPVFTLSDTEVFKMPGYNRNNGILSFADFIPHYYKLNFSYNTVGYEFKDSQIPNQNQICVKTIEEIEGLKQLLIEL